MRLDNPRRVFGAVYHCSKYGWNRCTSFDNMHVLILNEFGWKMPLHAPKWYLGGFDLNGEQSQRDSRRAPPCAETRHTAYKSLRSVHAFLHSCTFLSNPSNHMLYSAFNWPDTPKLPLHVRGSGPLLIMLSRARPSPHSKRHSKGSAVFARLKIVTDRLTYRPSYSVCNNYRPHLRSTAMRPRK